MLLAIDVGNTHTTVGLWQGENIAHCWRFATNKQHTADELYVKLFSLMRSENIETGSIEGACLASVVPNLTRAWCDVSSKITDKRAIFCSAETAGELFNVSKAYKNPLEIGADRVADAVAAKALYGAPVVVVDFGTATNIEVVNSQGIFEGGVIAPGVKTSTQALVKNASKLGAIEYQDPHTSIGKSTAQAMQIGILYGEAERVDGFVSRIFKQLGAKAHVVATGGFSSIIAPLSSTIKCVNNDLTLIGLRTVYEHHTKQQAGA
jgi:type III pantothenate kinase